jgi:phosphoglucosamine mutase
MQQIVKRKYFGTDGVRGRANNGKMNAKSVVQFAHAVGIAFSRGKEHHRYRALIGKDTRLSNYTIEPSCVAGLTGVGMDVLLIGPMPTPAVAYLTQSMRADVGFMLTASHNPFEDNGIKLFGPDGFKLTAKLELEIEALMDSDLASQLASPANMGRTTRIDEEKGQYKASVKNSLPKEITFGEMRVVIDCSHGAAYKIAPEILKELDAEVFTIGTDPDGVNINKECGSTHPDVLSKEVRRLRADFGIALDGDGDRVTLVDEKGSVIDGDQILALLAYTWKKAGRLAHPVVVGTSMTNLGLERYLSTQGITLERTDVGDHNILKRMREGGFNLGGEPSGHIVLSDFAKTGDGLLAALQVMQIIKEQGMPASQVCNRFKPVPQILENVKYKKAQGDPLEDPLVKRVITEVEARLFSSGSRLLVRPSGTEPLIRVMAEGDNRTDLVAAIQQVVRAIQSELK